MENSKMWHCCRWTSAVDEPLLSMKLFHIRELEHHRWDPRWSCCMASGLLIHCNQCSSQSRPCVTEAVCVPLQELWAAWEDMCQNSVFQICGACVQPTSNGIWLRLNSADVFCTICETRSITKAFHTITSLIEPFHAPKTADGQREIGWTFSWLHGTPTAPGSSAKSNVFQSGPFGSWLLLPHCGYLKKKNFLTPGAVMSTLIEWCQSVYGALGTTKAAQALETTSSLA